MEQRCEHVGFGKGRREDFLIDEMLDIAAFFFFAARGRSKDFVKAKWDALKGLKKALKKRRHIQRSRILINDYIWSLLEKELFLPRLTRRLRKN